MFGAIPAALLAWFLSYIVTRFILRRSDLSDFDLTLESSETATVIAFTVGFVVYIDPLSAIL